MTFITRAIANLFVYLFTACLPQKTVSSVEQGLRLFNKQCVYPVPNTGPGMEQFPCVMLATVSLGRAGLIHSLDNMVYTGFHCPAKSPNA